MLKFSCEPVDIRSDRFFENCCTCGLMYLRNARLFQRPISMIVKSLTPARKSCIAKLVLMECVPTFWGWKPNRSSPIDIHVALRCSIISLAFMCFGSPSSDEK